MSNDTVLIKSLSRDEITSLITVPSFNVRTSPIKSIDLIGSGQTFASITLLSLT